MPSACFPSKQGESSHRSSLREQVRLAVHCEASKVTFCKAWAGLKGMVVWGPRRSDGQCQEAVKVSPPKRIISHMDTSFFVGFTGSEFNVQGWGQRQHGRPQNLPKQAVFAKVVSHGPLVFMGQHKNRGCHKTIRLQRGIRGAEMKP
jgi:hypothetical protein